MQDLISAFSFLSQNIHLAGWIFIIGAAWKISAKVTKFFAGMQETTDRSVRMENTINTVATNHLPHLQEAIGEVNETLKDLHRDILTILLSKINSHTDE